MIGYVTIGALDSEASGKFYDAVFGAIGADRKFADGGWIGYGPKGSDSHSVYVCPPHDKKPATFGNGSMIAFKGANEAQVKAAYEAGSEIAAVPMRARRARGPQIRKPSTARICATRPATRSACIASPLKRGPVRQGVVRWP